MKKDIIALVLAAAAFAGLFTDASAQEKNSWFKKGYSFDVSIASARPFDQNMVSTTHGYSFGNGLFMGGGMGFEYSVKDNLFLTPVYAEGRWSILNTIVSPYIDARVGYMVVANRRDSFYFSPTAGLDIWKFSLFVGCDVLPTYNTGFKFGIGIHF